MSELLQQAIANLNLQPGETYRTTVNGHEVEVRILGPASRMEPHDESEELADTEMMNLWLDVPPSQAATIITVQRGEPLLPPPLEIDESDLTPE